jgi:Flp pilus assembly protein TadG
MISPEGCSAFARREDGASAIEFAILAPVFLAMTFSFFAYAIYFSAAHSIQQLAADAARTSIAGLDEPERNTLVAGFIERNAGGYILVDPARLQFSIGDKPGDTSQYEVILRYDAGALPIWNLYVPLPLPSREIVFVSSIRKGGI